MNRPRGLPSHWKSGTEKNRDGRLSARPQEDEYSCKIASSLLPLLYFSSQGRGIRKNPLHAAELLPRTKYGVCFSSAYLLLD